MSALLHFGNTNPSVDWAAAGAITTSALSTEQISLPAGSLQTAVEFNDPVRCELSRSGVAEITPGSSQITVPAAGVSDTSVILATYHLDAGVAVDATLTSIVAVECGAGNFIIKGNAAATASVKVAWLVAKF